MLITAEDEAADVDSGRNSQLALQQPRAVATAALPYKGQINDRSAGDPTRTDHQTSANAAGTMSNTSADVQNTSASMAMPMPAVDAAGINQMQSTLTAVQEDYIRMAGEQEEAAQAQAAADAMKSDADTQLYSTASNGSDSAVAGLFQPNYIPALPLNPRASVRRGNNALFQKLAAGQGTFCCHERMAFELYMFILALTAHPPADQHCRLLTCADLSAVLKAERHNPARLIACIALLNRSWHP